MYLHEILYIAKDVWTLMHHLMHSTVNVNLYINVYIAPFVYKSVSQLLPRISENIIFVPLLDNLVSACIETCLLFLSLNRLRLLSFLALFLSYQQMTREELWKMEVEV